MSAGVGSKSYFNFHYLAEYSIPQYAAEGGNASVWRSSRPHPDKENELQAVAIKVIRDIDSIERHWSVRDVFMRRLFREISLMVHFAEHDGFVHILDVYMTDIEKEEHDPASQQPARRDLYIVMPYIDRSLLDLVKLPLFKGGFTESLTRSFAKQLLVALSRMEQSNCIHRDLTLSNVLVGGDHPNYKLYLADFGLSRAYFDSNYDMTSADLVTLPYRPPELTLKNQQLLATEGSKLLSNKIDVWSLGIMLVECLSGEPLLYDVKDDVTLLKAIVERVDRPTELNERVKAMLTEAGFHIVRNTYEGNVKDISEAITKSQSVSKECVEVIRGMLRFHPDDRKSATELLGMDWFQDSEGGALPPQGPRENLREVENMSYEEMLLSIHHMCAERVPEHRSALVYDGKHHHCS
jgi:serine/threonine protein kinase